MLCCSCRELSISSLSLFVSLGSWFLRGNRLLVLVASSYDSFSILKILFVGGWGKTAALPKASLFVHRISFCLFSLINHYISKCMIAMMKFSIFSLLPVLSTLLWGQQGHAAVLTEDNRMVRREGLDEASCKWNEKRFAESEAVTFLIRFI